MAKAHLSSSQSFLEEEADLTCGICLEVYDDSEHLPKFLMCHHSFCIQCLQAYARTGKISCPNKCPEVTIVAEKNAATLKNNFYILPKVQKIVLAKKQAEALVTKTKSNWAEAVDLRRQSLSKLKAVQDSLRLLEGRIELQIEGQSHAVAIGQSLLDQPNSELKPANMDHYEEEHEESERELREARQYLDELSLIEAFSCQLKITEISDRSRGFALRALETRPLALDQGALTSQQHQNSHKPEVSASLSLLAYTLQVLHEHKLWTALCNSDVSYSSSDYSSEEDDNNSDERVYLRFRVNEGPLMAPVIIRLHTDKAPRMCNAFLQYCLDAGSMMSYKSSRVFKVDFGQSITAGRFRDVVYPPDGNEPVRSENSMRYLADPSSLLERPGAVRMRHRGRCDRGVYACSEFSILCSDHRPSINANDSLTTVFGYVEEGLDVCDQISRMDPEKDNITIGCCGSQS